jgi:alcohol dehydrogenase
MLSDIFPTGLECGVLNAQVKPGDIVAIVGAGPVGLAALLTAQIYSPAEIVMIDLDGNRLEVARSLGATTVVNRSDGQAVERIMALTNAAGVHVAIEAVGIPATFDICQSIISPGGRIASVGVHGKPVEFHIERLCEAHASGTLGHDPWAELHLRALEPGHQKIRSRDDLRLRPRARWPARRGQHLPRGHLQ